ncbi:MAG: hypothetical protein Q9191_006540 [Dirinaria sp. TL-2023a]
MSKDPRNSRWLSPLLLTADSALCALIIWKVPYTEIDWKAYMQQVHQYQQGERDYTLIKGDTGPLVYPAAHVYIYSLLYRVTNGGKDIFLAQLIFGGLYLSVLSLVMTCYRQAKAPPYIFPLLVLSKRMHSLFMLRLFNDCFAVGALFLAIYAYQKRIWTIGSFAYSFGVAIKMSLLLAAPGVGIMLLQALPFRRAVNAAFLMAQVQFTMALPFLPAGAKAYISRAFQFTRQFLFKWTVNWSHWTRPSDLSIGDLIGAVFKPLPPSVQQRISLRVTPDYILTTILSSMAIGLLCARSLHYQFYAYIAWSSPFLLWKAGLHPILVYSVWAAQEWAWNVYPSTNASSMVVVGCLAVQVFGVWWSTRDEISNVQLAEERNQTPASGSKSHAPADKGTDRKA